MSWFSKNKIVVDTKDNRRHELIWTLIDNKTGECTNHYSARWLVEALIAKDSGVKEMIQDKINSGVDKTLDEQMKEKFNKHFTFYVGKDIAPFILNQLDALECVGEWSIGQDALLENYVEIDYKATRQVLFQTENGVVIKQGD